jgi:hypothetical protein
MAYIVAVARSVGGFRMGWRQIEFADIPSRAEFEQLTLELLRRGITNSDQMRNEIRVGRQLILKKSTGTWNATPSDKFVNEHAWTLEDLVVRKIIEKTTEKEYRLL